MVFKRAALVETTRHPNILQRSKLNHFDQPPICRDFQQGCTTRFLAHPWYKFRQTLEEGVD